MPAKAVIDPMLGPNLFRRVRRRHPDFSARAFCKHLGISTGALSNHEHGKTPIPLDVCIELARYLGDADVVFGDALAKLGCAVVPDEDTDEALHPVGLLHGLLANASRIVEALDPAGDGGAEVTGQELEGLLLGLEELQRNVKRALSSSTVHAMKAAVAKTTKTARSA